MAAGVYTAPARVERDGALVCFEGERMTMQEAEDRGLLDGAEPEPEPEPEPDAEARKAELMAMKAAELEALADSIGAEHARGATKAVLADAIMAREREAAGA